MDIYIYTRFCCCLPATELSTRKNDCSRPDRHIIMCVAIKPESAASQPDRRIACDRLRETTADRLTARDRLPETTSATYTDRP